MKDNRKKDVQNNIITTLFLCLIFALGLGLWYMDYSLNCQTTKDAYIEGKLISVSPKISGYVTHLYVNNDQEVKKGDLLLELDSMYYEVAMKNAIKKLNETKLKLKEKENLSEEDYLKKREQYLKPKSPHSKFNFSQMGYDKYARVYDEIIVENQENVNDKSCLTEQVKIPSPKNDKILENNINEQSTEETTEELLEEIKHLEAEIEQIKLNLSNTKLYAAQDGKISAKNINEGDYVDAALPILAIIPKRVWISANFTPEQAEHLAAGQSVMIKLNKYPRRRFKGVIDCVQYFSNNDKPVGIVPVRIMFTEDYSEYEMKQGTSATVTVRTK